MSTQVEADVRVEHVPVDTLNVHPKSAEIYGDTHDDDLLNSIEQHGIQVPLMVTEDMVIVSGHRRFSAAQELGLPTVPVIVQDFQGDDLAVTTAVVETNRYRKKTDWQIAQESKALYEVEQERARQRQLKGTKPDFDEETGPTPEIVSKKVGAPRRKVDAGAKVASLIDILNEHELHEQADALEDELKQESVTAAHNLAKKQGWTKLLQVKHDDKRQEIAEQIKDDSSDLQAEIAQHEQKDNEKKFRTQMTTTTREMDKLLEWPDDPYWINGFKSGDYEGLKTLANSLLGKVASVEAQV